MTKFFKSLSTGAAAIALAASPAAFAQDTAETATAPAGPALWSVSDEDTTIYLFGTVHALRPDVDWYKPYVAEALAASGEVVTEVDMEKMAAAGQSMVMAAMLPPGTTLRSLMTDENRTEYEAAMTSAGLPAETFDTFEPWFAAVNLQMIPIINAGYDIEVGVDQLILARAGEAAERGALETIEFQLGMLDGLPQDSQLEMLDQAAEGADEVVTMIDDMVSEWMAGDEDGLAELMNAGFGDDPAVRSALLTNRNINWANWIETRLETPGTVFIAVGAGHLAGDDSVQVQLDTLGIETTRLN